MMRHAFAIAVLFGLAAAALACNVPVFRYALERWHPDPYRVTLFHRGPLTEAQQALVDSLSEAAERSPANLQFRRLDVDKLDTETDRTLYAAQSSPALPWLVVQYPQTLRIEQAVWAGPLTEEAAARLVASPLRVELVRRLAAGQTAVWLMLECGDPAKDDAVAAQLQTELKKLAEKLKLPELTSNPEDNLLSDAPLKVDFSLLRVPRNVGVEQPLVELLLHAEPDLKDFAEPMVFPVFGRGRALLPLIGAGITADNIHESAAFLVGACSCEIKELNPGFDLLLAADWDVLLFKSAPPPEVVAARQVAAAGEPQLVAIPAGAAPTATSTTGEPEESMLEFHYQAVDSRLLFAGAAVLAVFVFVFVAVRRFV